MDDTRSQSRPRRRLRGWHRALALALLAPLALLPPYLLRPEPDPPLAGPALASLSYSEVSFASGDLALAGMLFLPGGDGPFPAAVIIHGSGTSRRDNPWYLTVTERLQAEGIAVLLPDKRGSEKSEGDWRTATLADLGADTEAAVAHLRGLPGIAPEAVGLVGMSQGGWIAPIVAARDTALAFAVSMSGAAVASAEQLLFEEENNIRQLGTYRFVARLIAPFTARRIQRGDYWRHLAGFDPLPYWREVEAPAFAAFGAGDTNVPVAESVARLEGLGRGIRVKVYPDGGHAIRDRESGRVQEAFLADLVTFIHQAVR